jgi:hypothetical protein
VQITTKRKPRRTGASCSRLAAFPTGLGCSFRIVGEVAAAAPLTALLAIVTFLRALLASAIRATTLLASLHVVVFVGLLASLFLLVSISTLIGHRFLPWLVLPPRDSNDKSERMFRSIHSMILRVAHVGRAQRKTEVGLSGQS